MKKIFIVGNWKCNPVTLAEAKELFDLIAKGAENIKDAEVIICPPFLYLSHLQNGNIKLGAQDCFYEEKGAFTGEISAVMIKNMGAEYVILGHSERRKYQQETDDIIKRKIDSALRAGLIPIVCIDNLSQLENLKGINGLLIAYEPFHCIGNGKACDPKKAEKMRILIEKEIGKGVSILYGGSVNSQNAPHYVKAAGFFGLLVGGASLKAEEFVKIANSLTFS